MTMTVESVSLHTGIPLPQREAFSINDSCLVLGQGRSKLYWMIRVGLIETIRIGARQYIRRADLERIIEKGLSPRGATPSAESAAVSGPPLEKSKASSQAKRGRPRKALSSGLRGEIQFAGRLAGERK